MLNRHPEDRPRRNLLGSFIIASIVYIILGVYMVMHPEKVEHTLCYAFGILLTIYGAINIISFLINKDSDENLFFELVFGVIAAAFGVFTLFTPDTIINILLVIIGVIIIIDGVMNLKRSFHLRDFGVRKWYVFFIFAAVSVAAGLITIIFHDTLRDVLIIMLGINLIYEGILGLIIMFQVSRNKRRVERNLMMINADYISARRQPYLDLFVQPDEKSYCAIRTPELCGIALINGR